MGTQAYILSTQPALRLVCEIKISEEDSAPDSEGSYLQELCWQLWIKTLKGMEEIGQTQINVSAEMSCVSQLTLQQMVRLSRSLADVNYYSSEKAIGIYAS